VLNDAVQNSSGYNSGSDAQGLQFKFRMIHQNRREMITMYNANEYYLGPEQGILLMEIAYSFLRLLNKSTKHLFSYDLYKLCKAHFSDISPDPEKLKAEWGPLQHENLFRFKEGLSIRSEILRFYRQFYVFYENNLISPLPIDYKDPSNEYDFTRLARESHVKTKKGSILSYLLKEVSSSHAIVLTSSFWNIDEAKIYIEEYYIKNLFTTLYKYTSGMYKLYHNDDYCSDLLVAYRKLIVCICKETYNGVKKLHEQFPKIRSLE